MARPYERFPRPLVPYYETRFPYLSQGDIFDDVPFAIIGPELAYVEGLPGVILQPVVVQRAITVSPTCDFRRPSAAALQADSTLSPYTLQDHLIVAPIYPLTAVAAGWGPNRAANLHLLRRYDALRRYMYLPPLPGKPDEQEWVADLSRTDNIALGLVVRLLDRRLTQLTFPARMSIRPYGPSGHPAGRGRREAPFVPRCRAGTGPVPQKRGTVTC